MDTTGTGTSGSTCTLSSWKQKLFASSQKRQRSSSRKNSHMSSRFIKIKFKIEGYVYRSNQFDFFQELIFDYRYIFSVAERLRLRNYHEAWILVQKAIECGSNISATFCPCVLPSGVEASIALLLVSSSTATVMLKRNPSGAKDLVDAEDRATFIFFTLSFTVLHNDPAAHQDHCGRCRIRTQDLCPKSLVSFQ